MGKDVEVLILKTATASRNNKLCPPQKTPETAGKAALERKAIRRQSLGQQNPTGKTISRQFDNQLTMSLQSNYNNGVFNLNLQTTMGTIQIRIDEQTKNSAKKILESLGMDISGAIKIYLKQIILRKGLPFKVLTENGMTPEEEDEILKASEEMKKGINCVGPFEGEEIIEHFKKLMKDK